MVEESPHSLSANQLTENPNKIKVWDLPTRLFHWGLLAAVFYSWFSVTILEDMQQHFYAGYAVMTLLLFRLLWGFVGSAYSRFRSFSFPVAEILAYAKKMGAVAERPYLGHNPLGSLAALAMLLALAVQVMFGLFSTDDYFYGPLAGLVSREKMSLLTRLHLINVNVIYGLIGLHVLMILYYKFIKREPLTKAMISGYKDVRVPHRQHPAVKSISPSSNLLALLLLLICVALVYYLVTAYVGLLPADDYDYF